VDAEIAKEGMVNILVQFHDFHGWDAKALWDDIKFSTTHCTKIKRIALVGEKAWQSGWLRFASRLLWRRFATSMPPNWKRQMHGSPRLDA
jgi:hypothetical protein